MVIKNLEINGFRNLLKKRLEFCRKKNLIFGPNGAGKTSILEAIFLTVFRRSFLNIKKSELVNHHLSGFSVRLEIENLYGHHDLQTSFYDGEFSILLNNKKINISDINRYFYVIFFSSSNYSLYTESKTYMRKMIDRFIFGVNSLYIHYILSYNRAIRQKNFLLKTRREFVELSSWNRIIADMGTKIIKTRLTFMEKLNQEIEVGFGKKLEFVYSPSIKFSDDISVPQFIDKLEKVKANEIQRKRALVGPHLDKFELHLNERNLKYYSAGEKKIHLLMAYISFIGFFRELFKEYPVFLVDDFDATMDKTNKDFLIDNLKEIQIIATSVNKNSKFDKLVKLEKEN